MTQNKFGKLIPSIGMVVRRVKSNTSPLYAYGIMQDARPSDCALCLLKHQAGKMKLKLFQHEYGSDPNSNHPLLFAEVEYRGHFRGNTGSPWH